MRLQELHRGVMGVYRGVGFRRVFRLLELQAAGSGVCALGFRVLDLRSIGLRV